jgi:Fur family iron response transcriptional regulator
MSAPRPYAAALERLKRHRLRPTRQRLALVKLLFEKGDRHLSADRLHEEAKAAGIRVSLATVYNTLNQFTAAGLLREVVVESGRAFFDTNVSDHHHFLVAETGELVDIPAHDIAVARLPEPPAGTAIDRVDIIVRVGKGN